MESVSSNNTYGYASSAMWENERKVREAAQSPIGGNSISLGDADAREYLPQFIVRRFGDDLPVMADGCSLKAKLKPDEGILKYRYTVSWFEDGPIHQEIEKLRLDSKNLKKVTQPKERKATSTADCTKSSKSRCCEGDTSKLPTTTASEYPTIQSHEVNVELAKAHENSIPNVRLCDGPCGSMRSVNDLRILGRCDHAICTLCVVNAPMIPQEDGSMGCCNKRCFAADIIARVPDEKRKHQLYQVLFNGKNWDPIFKLYTGDARRSAMPRRDASLYSSGSSCGNISSSKSASFISSTSGSSCSSVPNSSVTPLTTQSSLARYQASSAPSGSSVSASKSYSSLSDVSQYSELRFANEMLMLNLIVLETSYFSTIKRHRFEQEVGAKTPFFDAVEALMGSSASRNLFNKQTRIFYCTTDTFNPNAILEVDVAKYGKLPINVFANNLGVASFLIDYTNKIVRGRRPLYKPPGAVKA